MVGEEAKTEKKKMIATPAVCQRQSYVAVLQRLSRADDSLLCEWGEGVLAERWLGLAVCCLQVFPGISRKIISSKADSDC